MFPQFSPEFVNYITNTLGAALIVPYTVLMVMLLHIMRRTAIREQQIHWEYDYTVGRPKMTTEVFPTGKAGGQCFFHRVCWQAWA